MHPKLQRQKELIDRFFCDLDPKAFDEAIQFFLDCKGKIFFTGVGKSGVVAENLAQIMTSLGTKALFLSPMNALHGDLGMIDHEDKVVMISKSGNTEELFSLALLLKERKIPMMGLFCNAQGKLHAFCQKVAILPIESELCPYDLSPTTSSVVQMIFGNTLAVALMEKKNFSINDYLLNHPSGTIGKKISLKVQDVMLQENFIPICYQDQNIQEILVELSDKRCGCLLVLDENKAIQGVFTDGDLRRAIKKQKEQVFTKPVKEFMTCNFLAIKPEATLIEALKIMQNIKENKQVGALPVIDGDQLVGIIRIHDILALGLN